MSAAPVHLTQNTEHKVPDSSLLATLIDLGNAVSSWIVNRPGGHG